MTANINDRDILIVEYSTERNWLNKLPNNNWLCILVDNGRPRRYIDEVINKMLIKDVSYVCTVGEGAERNHDLVDEEIAFREVDIDKPYLPKHFIQTTWHTDFEEGIWFAINAANHDEVAIDKVVILDLTSGAEMDRINRTLERIKK